MSSSESYGRSQNSVHDDAEKGLADVVIDMPQPPPRSVPPLLSPALSSTSTAVATPITTPNFSPKPSFISSAGSLAVVPYASPSIESKVEATTPAPAAPVATPDAAKTKPAAQRPESKVSRIIRARLWFNAYRKFFTFVLTFNVIGIALAAAGKFEYADHHIGALVLGNLLCAVLMRNEIFGRFLYLIVNTLFAKWTPLWFRLGCTSALQHLGGIHSGCATSGVLWLIYKVIDIFIHHNVNHDAVLVTGVLTNICVIVSIASAFPWVRNTHHNMFERHHRFVGWLGLAATWIFVILGDSYDSTTRTWRSGGGHLIGNQEFWFVLGMTVFVVLPWLFVRRVPVEVEVPSPKVAVLKFKRGMQQGLLGRISRTCALEYHAFGIISAGTKADCHYMICGVQGDFTRGLVADPPTHIWTRELKFAGVSNTSKLYKRGIRICTGTGIGAALSTCIQSRDWFLIWIGSDQEKTFGPTIAGLIYEHIEPERRVLWDSKKEGRRPDMMGLVRDAYTSFGAEVVFITSNWGGNQELMQGCKVEGIPAFGTLWDF
ncbi:hypothetical protein BKA62DRAFT_430130 [Auriculariales sp. MPI-PUGE-AT-0066]|nr:hypothetical protein BKA62DRAFT_430130 [Auriculariales sp. MPI-PUGE-AT-0066]